MSRKRQKGERGGCERSEQTERARTLPLCSKRIFTGGEIPLFAKKSQDLAKQAGQNRKIRAIAHFNELKTYKSAKKISLFLVRLLSGLRLLYGRNLLL